MKKEKKKLLQIAVQIIVPGGKNVVKVLTVYDAVHKISRALCAREEGPCSTCSLKDTDICEITRYDEDYMAAAADALQVLFDGNIKRVLAKHPELKAGL